MTLGKIETATLYLEKTRGIHIASFLIAFALMIIACIYVRPAIDVVALGRGYAALSQEPFGNTPSSLGFRILTPAISYILGLRGKLIIITNLLFALTFLAVTYRYFRKNLTQLNDALFATAVFAFSLVTLTTIYYGGYCDSLTYLIVLLMWMFRSNLLLCSVLFLLGLLNRESIVFLLPWFVFLQASESTERIKVIIRSVFLYSLSLGIYFAFRMWIASFREVEFSTDYYFSPFSENFLSIFKKSYGFHLIGIFSVFKAFWIMVLIALQSFWKKHQFNQIISIALLLFLVWLQVFFAWDTSRLMTLAFPVMFISLLHVFENNTLGFRSWCWPVLILNFMVPQLYTAEQILEYMNSTIGKLLDWLWTGQAQW
ncbi:MAG TPA: hypothetical protein VHP63_02665 [candidate division Zixibacteria bacterium]|nr:hypothetical protein [candidate division Zixibacteria bacterium]